MGRFKGLKIGVQSWALRNFPLPEVVRLTAGLGVEHLELCTLGPAALAPEDPAKIAQAVALCKEHGIKTESFNAKFSDSMDPEEHRPWFELGRQLGARVLTGGVGTKPLVILDTLSEEYGMRVGMHNHGPGGILSDVDAIGHILENHSPRIGLCVDTGHYLRLPLNPLAVMRAFPERVHTLHLRDMDPDKDPVKGDGGNYKEHVVGTGPLDLKGLVSSLLDWRYQGVVALEYKPNPDNPIPDLRQATANIEAALQ